MSFSPGISASAHSISGEIAGPVVNPTRGLAASGVGLFVPTLSGTASSVVEISYLGRLISAAIVFQEQLVSPQIGTMSIGPDSDISSLMGESQRLVNAFNELEGVVAGTNSMRMSLGDSLPWEFSGDRYKSTVKLL